MRDDTDSTSPVDDLVRDRLEHSRRAVDVLAEAVAVLRSFGTDDTHLTVDEFVARTGLTLGVVQELVQALVTTGLLEPTGISYRLSTLLFELGMRASRPRPVRRRRLGANGPAGPGRDRRQVRSNPCHHAGTSLLMGGRLRGAAA